MRSKDLILLYMWEQAFGAPFHVAFQQVPYHRIFIMLFLELNTPDAILENINFQVMKCHGTFTFILHTLTLYSRTAAIYLPKLIISLQVLTAYCNMLHILRPVKAPGFAYAWLEIVSHRVFMGRILATTNQPNGGQKGTYVMERLALSMLLFK